MAIAIRRRDHQATGQSTPSVHLPREERDVLQILHPNLMLAGPTSATAAAITALSPVLRPSTAYWQGDEPLPTAALGAPETLVVPDASTLSRADQRRLLDWLKINERATQVVSATPICLLELVEKGSFDAALYYALNVLYFDLLE